MPMPNQARALSPVVNKFSRIPATTRIRKGDGREWVYFLEAPAARLVKIGHTTNLKWRLTGLQTQCPVQLELVGLIKAPTAAEFVFHRICSAAHSHGEWFHLTEPVLAVIAAVDAHEGEQLLGLQLMALAEKFGVPAHETQAILARGTTWQRALSDREADERLQRKLDAQRI